VLYLLAELLFFGGVIKMNKRIIELDSIRGLAALSVVLGHILYVLPPLPTIVQYSPIRVLWAGHEAVILFFILSGFVLSMPFINRKEIKYTGFLIKRIFRIYIPYIIAVLFALILKQIFYANSTNDIAWVDKHWGEDITAETLIGHLFLVTNYNTLPIDPVIWSLVHEMRISIIFPLLIFIVLKLKLKKSIILAISLSVIGIVLTGLGLNPSEGYLSSYAHSIHYVAMFIIGALLAVNYEKLVGICSKLSTVKKSSLLIIGLCLYTLQIGIGFFIQSELLLFFREWIIALGATILIVFSMASMRASNFLNKKGIVFFGKISYSLYLFHIPILFASLYFFNDKIPTWAILIIVVGLTVLVSTLSWKYIEDASIKMGRFVANKVANIRKTSEVSVKQ
jgi:peptidoglycan/LPS O-acetylase OafA/YrhL